MSELLTINEERIIQGLKTAMPEIQEPIDDPDILEVYVNPDCKLWKVSLTKGRIFTGLTLDPKKIARALSLIAASVKEEFNEQKPSLKAEFPGSGYRIQAEIPPIVENPTFNLRKHASKVYPLEDYLAKGRINQKQYAQIKKAVAEHKTIIAAGAIGSGKTTFLNALIREASKDNTRFITIEDTLELKVDSEDKVCFRSKEGVASMDDLLVITLRKYPGLIVVGEIRVGEAAMAALEAWMTGHSGFASLHANSAKDALRRLEVLMKKVYQGDPSDVISRAINMIIYMKKDLDNIRVTEIIEISPMETSLANYNIVRVE